MARNTNKTRKTRKNKRNTTKKHNAWGYHLMINAGRCDPHVIRDKAALTAFAKQLVIDIDMIPYGEPHVYRFGKGPLRGNSLMELGHSLVQLIQTSNITAHCDEVNNDVYLDIFSCKWFDKAPALKLFREVFKPKTLHQMFIERQATH